MKMILGLPLDEAEWMRSDRMKSHNMRLPNHENQFVAMMTFENVNLGKTKPLVWRFFISHFVAVENLFFRDYFLSRDYWIFSNLDVCISYLVIRNL